MRRLVLACPFLAALAATAAPADAQNPGPAPVTVTGTVTDSVSGAPVAGAVVTLAHPHRTVWTDDHGRLLLAKVDPGDNWVMAEQLGYKDGFLSIRIADGMQPLSVVLEPNPVLLGRLEVIAERLQTRTEAVLTGGLRAFDTRDLAHAMAWSVFDLLRTKGAVTLMPCQRPHTVYCVWFRGDGVPAQVYLDGIPLYGGMDELQYIPITDLYRVEVYHRGVFIQVFTRWWALRAATHKGWESELPLFIPGPTVGSYW